MKNLILALTSVLTIFLLVVCLLQHQALEKRDMEISDLQTTLVVKQAYINNLKSNE